MKEDVLRTVMLMNRTEEALELSAIIKKSTPQMEVTIADHLDHFIQLISTHKIDCFIFDWNYSAFTITDLVEKVRKSNKYKRAPIAFVTDKKDARLPDMYAGLRTDLVITRPFVPADITGPFIKILAKKDSKIIPEEYEVMLLDDNPAILEIMSGHMQEFNHQKFSMCRSLIEAKKLIAEKDFDMFLIDWNLGDGSCLDLIEHIRALKNRTRLNEAFIMVITGRDDVDDIMTLLRYKVKDHIIKPFEYEELEEKLIYGLERHKKVFKKAL